jgi:hypothetical protein
MSGDACILCILSKDAPAMHADGCCLIWCNCASSFQAYHHVASRHVLRTVMQLSLVFLSQNPPCGGHGHASIVLCCAAHVAFQPGTRDRSPVTCTGVATGGRQEGGSLLCCVCFACIKRDGERVQVSRSSEFRYLGCVFHETKGVSAYVSSLAAAGSRAMWAMRTRCADNSITGPGLQVHLFNALVAPILGYLLLRGLGSRTAQGLQHWSPGCSSGTEQRHAGGAVYVLEDSGWASAQIHLQAVTFA